MDYIEVTVLDDDGEHTTRALFNVRHIIHLAEVHPTMIGEVPAKARTILKVEGYEDPIPITDSYDDVVNAI